MTSTTNPFDRGENEAMEYDAWYDSPRGHAILESERRCVRALLDGAARPWLDLGTGSGRFGADPGIDVGLDPAAELLRLAASRMPSVVLGVAEAIPIRDTSLGAVLSVAVFEFLPDPEAAMREVARTLRPGGRFVIGFFPRGSAWALAYTEQGRDEDSVFHGAHFFTLDELCGLAVAAGLSPDGVRSTLSEAPDEPPSGRVLDGAHAGAGFMAALLVKPEERRGDGQ